MNKAKIKSLLFGAGAGAGTFMANTEHEREFIGLVDNDLNKIGKTINGLYVYAPTELSEIAFEEIVITTQWALEVEKQLLEQLLIPRSKVILPPKNQLKKITPFYHTQTLALGRDIIMQLSFFAAQINLPLVADFGTLLGLIRDKDIIAWDDDIDMSLPAGSHDALEGVLNSFISASQHEVEWRFERIVDKDKQPTSYLLMFTDPKGQLIEFKTSFSFRQNESGKSIHLPSLGMWYAPEVHFNATESILFHGVSVKTPVRPNEYLTFLYGDWLIPKKNIQMSDYAHTQPVDFDDIQNAGFCVEVGKS
ncbi:LicD family protein [Algibacillus agarilyticus]|uniref:LicD family protein n=1 Tax=Algibacillus agarilyticus TaxID=2234133 RepID=UPI000DD030B7|nr:LicD family protein [Algibacillus agarilyticus]